MLLRFHFSSQEKQIITVSDKRTELKYISFQTSHALSIYKYPQEKSMLKKKCYTLSAEALFPHKVLIAQLQAQQMFLERYNTHMCAHFDVTRTNGSV